MLDVRQLRAGYGGGLVLHGLDLEVPAGSLVVLLGRNGVGKTTLLKTIMGLVPQRAGDVRLDGTSLGGLATHQRAARGVGFVPQGRQLFLGLSVLENVAAAAPTRRRSEAHRLAAQVLDEFPVLAPKLSAKAGTLSGGQQQMVAIARALVAEPKLILLDEPTEGIQPSIVDEIGDLLVRLRDERGLTLLMAEQNLGFATGLADSLLLMTKGRIVRSVSAGEMLEDKNLQHEFLGV
jgi:urea ABC transporter ATP-binding protein UrtE